jgi:hypothetical protein
VLIVLVLWFLNSNANPLWHLIERWPRTLDRQSLLGKVDGLVRFGMPGASWTFKETVSGDRIALIKTGSAGESGLILAVSSRVPKANLADALAHHAELALGRGHRLRPGASPGSFEIKCDDPALLVAVIRKVAELLNHSRLAKYSAHSTGPADWEEVREYFGLGGPAA